MVTIPAQIRRLFFRAGVIASPALAMLASYLMMDPFDVLRAHDDYYTNNPVLTDRDFVSTTLYERDMSTKSYDTFVFGSSRSLALRCEDWITSPTDGHCFHFDAWSETLFGIHGKVRLIEARRGPLRRALLVFDESVLARVADSEGHLFMKHPDVSGKSPIPLQVASASAFFSNLFLVKYVDFRMNGTFRSYMKETLEDNGWTQNKETNDLYFTAHDRAIAAEGEEYWRSRPQEFGQRAGGSSTAQIGPAQLTMLNDMKGSFDRLGSQITVIIPPLYDQRRMAPEDVETLRSIFGARRVFDFSGPNEFSADEHNFYDRSHFRPELGRHLIELISQAENQP